jgi:hypothetical protein
MSELEHEDLRYYFGDLQDRLSVIPESYTPGELLSQVDASAVEARLYAQ